MDLSAIGNNIKSRRLELGYTQAELAEKSGVSNVHISHIETGAVAMSLDSLVDICHALETTPDYVLLGQYNLPTERVAAFIDKKDLTQDELRFLIEASELLEKSKINRQ